MLRTAWSSSQCGAIEVIEKVPRQSTFVPSTSPVTRQMRAVTPSRSASGLTGSIRSDSRSASSARQPSPSSVTSGPSAWAAGSRPWKSSVAPDRAVP